MPFAGRGGLDVRGDLWTWSEEDWVSGQPSSGDHATRTTLGRSSGEGSSYLAVTAALGHPRQALKDSPRVWCVLCRSVAYCCCCCFSAVLCRVRFTAVHCRTLTRSAVYMHPSAAEICRVCCPATSLLPLISSLSLSTPPPYFSHTYNTVTAGRPERHDEVVDVVDRLLELVGNHGVRRVFALRRGGGERDGVSTLIHPPPPHIILAPFTSPITPCTLLAFSATAAPPHTNTTPPHPSPLPRGHTATDLVGVLEV